MVIPIQYKHDLFVKVEPDSVYNEETGRHESSGTPEWVKYGKCRDELNGKGQKVATVDGELYLFYWSVYCPLSVQDMPLGSLIQVRDVNGEIRAEKELVSLRRGEFNLTLWL